MVSSLSSRNLKNTSPGYYFKLIYQFCGSWWALVMYRFRAFLGSGDGGFLRFRWLWSPIWSIIHVWGLHCCFPVPSELRSLSSAQILHCLLCHWFQMAALRDSFCSLSAQTPPPLSLLTHQLNFQSIYNFSERTKKVMFEIYFSLLSKRFGNFSPKACFSSISCTPCLFPFIRLDLFSGSF